MIRADEFAETAGHQFGVSASKLFGFIFECRSDAYQVTMRLVCVPISGPSPTWEFLARPGYRPFSARRNQTTQGSLPITAVTACTTV